MTEIALQHLSRRDNLRRSLDWARSDFIENSADRIELGDQLALAEVQILDDLARDINTMVDRAQARIRCLDVAKESTPRVSHLTLREIITEAVTDHYPLTPFAARYLTTAVVAGAGEPS